MTSLGRAAVLAVCSVILAACGDHLLGERRGRRDDDAHPDGHDHDEGLDAADHERDC